MKFTMNDKSYFCPVELTVNVIGGKWKVLLLWKMKEGSVRYGEFKRHLPGITHKMLSQCLRELEKDGIVYRYVHQVIPPAVEYSLTDKGRALIPVLNSMQDWGMSYSETTAVEEERV